MSVNKQTIINRAIQTLKIESDSILELTKNINDDFVEAVNLVYNCPSKIVVTGIGKSGQIARKLASTLTSTGTPALFLHPAESSHGDLGIISKTDVVIAISYGGEAVELHPILKFIARQGNPLIALTGQSKSTLAQAAQALLYVKVEKEACPLNLAPTSSSTATLAMGDALAMSVLELKGFNAEKFAVFHPSGSLGVRLQKIKDIMISGDSLPFVHAETPLKDVLTKMTHQSVRGAAGVIDKSGQLMGIITDGDIRRFLEKNENPFLFFAKDLMSKTPKTIDVDEMTEKALFMMEQNKIQVLIVTDSKSDLPLKPVGMIVYQDLLTKKVK